MSDIMTKFEAQLSSYGYRGTSRTQIREMALDLVIRAEAGIHAQYKSTVDSLESTGIMLRQAVDRITMLESENQRLNNEVTQLKARSTITGEIKSALRPEKPTPPENVVYSPSTGEPVAKLGYWKTLIRAILNL